MKDRLIALRKAKNLTQYDIAALVDGERSKVSGWENGERMPAAKDIIILCEFFNVSADYLLGLTDEPRPVNELIKLIPHEENPSQ